MVSESSSDDQAREQKQVLGGFILASIALFFGITYGLGADLTIAARYHFVYFPAVIVLLGATLAVCWDASTLLAGVELGWTERQQSLLRSLEEGKAVALIWLMGCIGGLTVVSNLGYQRLIALISLVPIIHISSSSPHRHCSQNPRTNGRNHGVGFGVQTLFRASGDRFTNKFPFVSLAHQEPNARISTDSLQRISLMPRPLDLWMVNYLS